MYSCIAVTPTPFMEQAPRSSCFSAPPTFVCVVIGYVPEASKVNVSINYDPLMLFARAQTFFKFLYSVSQPNDFSSHFFFLNIIRHCPFFRRNCKNRLRLKIPSRNNILYFHYQGLTKLSICPLLK